VLNRKLVPFTFIPFLIDSVSYFKGECVGFGTNLLWIFIYIVFRYCGPGSSVGIAAELRPGLSGIESRWGRDFPPVQTGPGTHAAYCKMATGSFPGVKCGWGVLLTTHPLPVPRPWKSRAIPLPTLWTILGL